MVEAQPTPAQKVLFYFLVAFNLLFLAYVFTVGYYNRLALGDYGYLWAIKEYGILNPFKYWFFHWQGRFGPQFLATVVFLLYQLGVGLFFYPILLSALFIYSIYQLLTLFFSLSKLVLLNCSILLFSALLLTTFELSTFYWINASAAYFGGMGFALLGIVFILKKHNNLSHYLLIAFCFLYVGSSSEHIGVLLCFLLFIVLIGSFFMSAYVSEGFRSHLKNFTSHPVNKKLLVAFFFCLLALVVMILAPGTKVRMEATQHITNPVELIKESFYSTMFVCAHIFFKLPYIIPFIPLFLLFGSHLKVSKVTTRINYFYVLLLCAVVMLVLIFASNLPIAYAIGQYGPLRAYVYVSFLLVAMLFLLCTYTGLRYQSKLKNIWNLSVVSLVILFVFVFYTFSSELPLLRKYNESDTQRITLLNEYKKQNRTDPILLPSLYQPDYLSITEMWRTLTRTDKLRSPMTDMPVIVGEISEVPDWRNDQIRLGLDLKFKIYRAPQNEADADGKIFLRDED